MITAQEALRLPTAKLSPSNQESVEKLLSDIENHIRANMSRHGFYADNGIEVDPTRVNGAIVLEVERRCRSAGWLAQFQQLNAKSALSGKMVVAKFQIELRPTDASYEAYEKEILS